MTLITMVLGVLAATTVWFGFIFGKDAMSKKEQWEKETSFVTSGIIGFATNFFDTLGIGSFAPTTALFKAFKQVNDRIIPGTLNVSMTIPVVLMAFIFMTVIEVEPITLIAMLVAATLGAWIGAGIIAKLPEKKIQLIMGIALFVAAFLMFSSRMGWMPGGGEAIGLTGINLIIGIVGHFILGALMTAGIGLYAPSMALVYFLGMSPAVAFPIMMGACAFLMPVASVKFVKEQAYNKKASVAITLTGIVAVFIAAFIVKSLPLDMLRWLVIIVILYTSTTMLRAYSKNTSN